MESKVSYTWVGLFVLLLGTSLVAAVLWLSAGGFNRKVYDTYLVYMSESVSGLNYEAPVKYRGVEVGRVKGLSLDHGERVRLELQIERGTPIKVDTVAVLRVQGLTGVAYIELEGGTRNAPALQAENGDAYPVIKTKPSLLVRLDTAVTDLLTTLNRVSNSLEDVMDADNRKALKKTLADMAILSDTLVAHKADIETSLRAMARTTENTAQASAQLHELIGQMQASAQALGQMGKDVSRSSAAVNRTMDKADDSVNRLNEEVLPQLTQTLGEVQGLSEELSRNPNALLFGRQPAPSGPGE